MYSRGARLPFLKLIIYFLGKKPNVLGKEKSKLRKAGRTLPTLSKPGTLTELGKAEKSLKQERPNCRLRLVSAGPRSRYRAVFS